MKKTQHLCMVVDRYTHEQVTQFEEKIIEIESSDYETDGEISRSARLQYMSSLQQTAEQRALWNANRNWCVDSCKI